MSEQKIIGVQFRTVGKSYDFYLPEDLEIEIGEFVIVNTARGKQIGKVTRKDMPPLPAESQDIQPVERIATSRDLMLKDMIRQKEEEVVKKTEQFLLENDQYDGVKVLDAEYSFDSSKLTLFLSYDNVQNFNMRNFIREAAPMFQDTRLEIRQVGPRDMAKEISGLGACGIEKRCCSRFLTEFSSISIRMAKSQNVSLTPSEITGICGRLRCCLAYENDTYEEALKLLPKRKKVIQTPLGEGKVIQTFPLSDSVLVDIPEVGYREIKRSELESGKMEEKKPEVPIFEAMVAENDGDVEMVSLGNSDKPEQHSRPRRESDQGQNQPSRSKRNNRRGKRPNNSPDKPETDHRSNSQPGSTEQPRSKPSRRSRRFNKTDNRKNENGK
mgnify:CR=1 FL=1